MNKKSYVDYKMIGLRIKSKRKELCLTQEMLAEELDVTVGYVSQFERGITKLSLDKLAEISGSLNCDISYFVTGSALENENYLQGELLDKFSKLSTEQKNYTVGFMYVMLKNSSR